MTATSNAAFWKGNAARRRRATAPKTVSPDPGTEQTRKHLQQPPWAEWPSELLAAAIDIDLAVRLLAGASLAQAQNPTRGAHSAARAWDDDDERLIGRYCGWRNQMQAIRWDGQAVLDCVVLGQQCVDKWMLRRALHLYATGKVLGPA